MKSNNNLAPIVLFIYNRPIHTYQTVEALKKNNLAKNSHLFIYSDGVKDEETYKEVQKVRDYIKTINGFKTITIIERDKNYGLANNIIDGVTKIINDYGKIIVLEDDLITSKYFLTFMNDALTIYKDFKDVGMIHGHIYNIDNLPQAFFMYKAGCLGWATWKDRWDEISFDGKELLTKIENKQLIHKFDINGSYPYTKMLQDQIEGKNSSWAIRVYASLMLKNKLTYYPGESLVSHIGWDIGTHIKGNEHASNMDGILSKKCIDATIIDISNNDYVINKLEDFYHSELKTKKPRFNDKDYRLLRNIERFTEISVDFCQVPIKVPDAASLLFLNHELFGLEIYKFNSIKKEPLIIDCGANIGLSIIYFKKLYPQAKIIAFEPDKKIFDYLKFNINSFQFKDIELINKGLWKEETILKFFSEGADGGRVADNEDTINIIQIETVKLSNYLRNNQTDFLKIDIEGAETEVLLECEEYLCNVKNIFIEYHSFINKNQTLSIILNILEKNGFRYYIEQIGIKSEHPFTKIKNTNKFDNQLNIFGYKNE
jgi:FkbM family methyltransferase